MREDSRNIERERETEQAEQEHICLQQQQIWHHLQTATPRPLPPPLPTMVQ